MSKIPRNIALLLTFVPFAGCDSFWDTFLTDRQYDVSTQPDPDPMLRPLRSIWGTSSTDIWAVGNGGTILHYDGTSWSPSTSGTLNDLYGVWAYDVQHAWAVGAGGTIFQWNGSNWNAGSSGTTNVLNGVWGTDVNNAWIVGASGTILQWNGSSWSPQSSGTTNVLTSVRGSDAEHVWAVGQSGTILMWNGTSWSPQPSNTSQYLYGVWASPSSSDVWIVGDATPSSPPILHWTGTWSMDNSAFVENLQSVWGNDPSYVWAVGDGASIVRWNGMAWVSVPTDGMGGWLFGVWGSPDMQDPQSVWAVGQDISMMGKILKVQQHP